MRKIAVVVLGLSVFFFLQVYATPPSPAAWTVTFRSATGLQAGDLVTDGRVPIGRVLTVERQPTGSLVRVTLAAASQARLREQATFIVEKAAGAARPSLRLVVFDTESPALAPGNRIVGAESETELALRRQMAVLAATLASARQRLDGLGQALESASRSAEREHLDQQLEAFLDALKSARENTNSVLDQEIDRWREILKRLDPPAEPKPSHFAS